MKKFKNILLKILLVTSSVAVVAGFVVVLTAAVEKRQSLVCKGVQATVDFETGLNFITTDEVVAKINHLSGGQITGKPLSAVDFRTLEQELRKNPYIDHAEVYSDQQQLVHAVVHQKQPLLRVINSDGVSYYLSDKKERMPLSDNFTARVLLAIGTVETREDLYGDSIIVDEVYRLAKFIAADTLLNALIDHVRVDERGEVELMPKWGGHSVVFGRAGDHMEEKFHRLKLFYREGLARIGWDKYSQVNVKFDGQVVGVRRANRNEEVMKTDSSETL